MSKKVLCYNRGCNQDYDPDSNPEGSCWYHPGLPFFHETYKGWSCCQKKSTDFTEFLNLKGCTSSKHSNVKTEDPIKIGNEDGEELVQPPKKVEARGPMYVPKERPSAETGLVDLPRMVTESLVHKLEELKGKDGLGDEAKDGLEDDGKAVENDLASIKIGTSCKNRGCRASYGPDTGSSCQYHPGYPVFHEGLKFWTCCQKRTSDFEAFLEQVGCERGQHLWFKPKGSEDDVDKTRTCRFDWHQTGSHVFLTIYSKLPLPEESVIKVNEVKVSIFVTFGEERKQFAKDMILYGVVDLPGSQVTFAPTKVELSLKKAEPIYWTDLEHT